MLIGVGASTWASGSQVWNGKTGTLMAKPMNRKMNIVYWKAGREERFAVQALIQSLSRATRTYSSAGLRSACVQPPAPAFTFS